MSAAALGLALAAACLHATWNVLLGGSRDVLAATAVAVSTSVVVAAPVAVLTWDVDRAAIPFLVVSGLLEVAYFFLLARAYQEHEVSVVYPLSRGAAPVLVLLGGLVVGDRPSLAACAGVVLVGCGVLAVRGGGRGDRRALALAGAVALCIAGYTLVDSHGIDHAAPVAYLELVLLPVAVASLAATRASRVRPQLRPVTVAAGAVRLRRLRARARRAAPRAGRPGRRGAGDERRDRRRALGPDPARAGRPPTPFGAVLVVAGVLLLAE